MEYPHWYRINTLIFIFYTPWGYGTELEDNYGGYRHPPPRGVSVGKQCLIFMITHIFILEFSI